MLPVIPLIQWCICCLIILAVIGISKNVNVMHEGVKEKEHKDVLAIFHIPKADVNLWDFYMEFKHL